MNNIGPLRFKPYFKPVLWGGSRIASLKGMMPNDEPVGESWEISGLEGFLSCVADGPFEGETIESMLQKYGNEILGRQNYRIYGNKFPLLVKFIDASKDLSIQVHPDDFLARERHGCWGKTELWYTLDPEPGAYVYSGLQSPLTTDELKAHIDNNTFGDVLAKFAPQRGDLFYLPAGRIHSIGAGNMILEIQQTSDITYRVYDYNRIDLNGKKRELHIDLALDAIDYRVHEDYMRHVETLVNQEIVLKECPYFTATVITLDKKFRLPIARYNSFRIIIATRGNGEIVDNQGNRVAIGQGETLLIPANTRWIDIIPVSADLEIVTSYIQ